MLKEGDLIGMIAPAGAATDAIDVQKARENLHRLGFEVLLGKNILSRHGYLGGTDQQRAEDFNQMVKLPEVKGIACMRGGYGTTRMLDLIDYAAFRENPKVVWGFSDITGLINALTRNSNVITFHGPTPASSWGDYDLQGMRKALMSVDPIGPLPAPIASIDPETTTLVPGVVEGRLVGGNLSLLSAVGGSKYAPDYTGAIIFIEEIGEEPYRVDRMLTQLHLEGAFAKAKGIAFGSLKLRSTQTPDDDPLTFTMLQMLQDRATAFGLPSCTGFPFGHIADQVTLPIGVRARLDATNRTLTVVESGVRH